ncbi:MAG TPA: hypothetical protein VEV45_03625 [Streptosporangiaceae bacterium]|nr:hypothetical protein [Streptosporangiaceae bacterium]
MTIGRLVSGWSERWALAMINIRITSIGILVAFAVALAAVIALTTGAAAHSTPMPNEPVQCCY